MASCVRTPTYVALDSNKLILCVVVIVGDEWKAEPFMGPNVKNHTSDATAGSCSDNSMELLTELLPEARSSLEVFRSRDESRGSSA